LRHRQVLEDALVVAVGQAAELRHHGDFVAGQALAGLALGDLVDQAVHAQPVGAEGEEGRPLADQLDFEAIGLIASSLASFDAELCWVIDC